MIPGLDHMVTAPIGLVIAGALAVGLSCFIVGLAIGAVVARRP